MDELRGLRASLMHDLVAIPGVAAVLERGELSTEFYANYLVSAYRYARESPVVMARAGARCITTHPAIGSYLLHHAEEEAGHYLWARDDLADLGFGDEDIETRWPLTSCAAMIAVMHHTASEANPVGLLGWMYLLESVGEDLGEAGTAGLSAALGGSSAVRFIGRHAVTDVGHAQEMDEVIATNVTDPDDWRAVLTTAKVVRDLYLGMFRDAGEAAGL